MSDHDNGPKCLRCIHYHSTYEINAPRGCKLYQMKSKMMPSLVVKQASGADCVGYKEAAHFSKEKEKDKNKIDFNDPKYW